MELVSSFDETLLFVYFGIKLSEIVGKWSICGILLA